MAEFEIKGGRVHLTLTPAEASGLLTFADEGREGLMTDESAARAYVGTKAQQDAATRAFGALQDAVGKLG